jgi:hypothetical protein
MGAVVVDAPPLCRVGSPTAPCWNRASRSTSGLALSRLSAERSKLPVVIAQTFPMPADPRVAMMVAGFDTAGGPIPMTPERFASVTDTWVVSRQTPSGVSDQLDVTRSLYCHGFFVYEFITVAVQQSFIALEAALAHRLDRPQDSLGDLIARANRHRLVDDAGFKSLDKGARRLRNGFSHARQQEVWTPGMAAPVIGSVFTTVATLWP